MVTAFLSLGSNLSPQTHMPAAARVLASRFPGARFSPLYRSSAVGFDGPDFLNAAAAVETELSPEALAALLHGIEHELGRRRDGPRFSDRSIDIDLVLYGDLVQGGDGLIELPRPELRDAVHVLQPIIDLAPELRDPATGDLLSHLLGGLSNSVLERVELPEWRLLSC
ncbi:MAG: 2-amino-4-hydroxy-6-hydroxymethyldihydropteridine diphosphokinase [Xanthomonadales bacterium]|nr:2-amino-4-hydroxy-6-hydroxymethyldihydropteridine diphosphokinase [Xanthomonadales bacterium]